MDLFGLGGKHAIVTGGNSGLGRAFAVALATGGADVFVPPLVRRRRHHMRAVECAAVRYEFSACGPRRGRYTQPGRRRLHRAPRVGRHRVNNAGDLPARRRARLRSAQWDATVAVNLTAAFEMSCAVARQMVAQGSGKVINICSAFTFLGGRIVPRVRRDEARHRRPHQGVLRRAGDAQHPGQRTGTRVLRDRDHRHHASNPAPMERVLERIPTERWGEPADLMGTVVFLASRASDYVNGHVLAVDGGYLVR